MGRTKGSLRSPPIAALKQFSPVSYTHLDVDKRQAEEALRAQLEAEKAEAVAKAAEEAAAKAAAEAAAKAAAKPSKPEKGKKGKHDTNGGEA